jgi:apolipoprotein N-acyltransferase
LYFLAHSQYQHLPLIQIANLFGTFGISALIAAVKRRSRGGRSGDRTQRIFSKRLWLSAALAGALIGASILYGNYQLKEIDANRQISSNCSAASVQTNVPTAVKEETDNAGAILDNLFVLSDQCIQAGAKRSSGGNHGPDQPQSRLS